MPLSGDSGRRAGDWRRRRARADRERGHLLIDTPHRRGVLSQNAWRRRARPDGRGATLWIAATAEDQGWTRLQQLALTRRQGRILRVELTGIVEAIGPGGVGGEGHGHEATVDILRRERRNQVLTRWRPLATGLH